MASQFPIMASSLSFSSSSGQGQPDSPSMIRHTTSSRFRQIKTVATKIRSKVRKTKAMTAAAVVHIKKISKTAIKNSAKILLKPSETSGYYHGSNATHRELQEHDQRPLMDSIRHQVTKFYPALKPISRPEEYHYQETLDPYPSGTPTFPPAEDPFDDPEYMVRRTQSQRPQGNVLHRHAHADGPLKDLENNWTARGTDTVEECMESLGGEHSPSSFLDD